MMLVEIHDVGDIRISLRRNRFRYSLTFIALSMTV